MLFHTQTQSEMMMLLSGMFENMNLNCELCKLNCLLVILCFIISRKVNKLISYLSEASFRLELLANKMLIHNNEIVCV